MKNIIRVFGGRDQQGWVVDFLLDLYIFYEQSQPIDHSKIRANRNLKRHDLVEHLCDICAEDYQVCLQYKAQQDPAGSLGQRYRKVHRTQADQKEGKSERSWARQHRKHGKACKDKVSISEADWGKLEK